MGAMQRYFQTISRIFFGLSSLSVLLLHLWPATEYVFSDRIESFLYFLVSLGVWMGAEFRESEEVVFRRSTKNDIRVSRELLRYFYYDFRYLFYQTDFSETFDESVINSLHSICSDIVFGLLFFQDKKVEPTFKELSQKLISFREYWVSHSSFNNYSSGMRYGVTLPHDIGLSEIPQRYVDEIDKLNRLSDEVHEAFVKCVDVIKHRVPEAFDEVITRY